MKYEGGYVFIEIETEDGLFLDVLKDATFRFVNGNVDGDEA